MAHSDGDIDKGSIDDNLANPNVEKHIVMEVVDEDADKDEGVGVG